MEISRQRIGQSIYETFYNKCECCEGAGFKKTNSIILHNLISNIKGINAIGNINEIEIEIDESFYNENYNEINKRIKSIQLPFKINFTKQNMPKTIYAFDKDLILKVKNNAKEVIEKNKIKNFAPEKSYRRKIKKNI